MSFGLGAIESLSVALFLPTILLLLAVVTSAVLTALLWPTAAVVRRVEHRRAGRNRTGQLENTAADEG